MKIFFLVDQFYIGGAGRVASILINGLIEDGHQVMVETDIAKEFTYALSHEVSVVPVINRASKVGVWGRMKNYLRRLRGHRQYVKAFNPDVIIAFLPTCYLDILLATIGKRIPIIVSDHTSMNRDLGFKINFIRHHIYGIASKAVILTKKDQLYLGRRVRCKEVIYNPLTFIPEKWPFENRRKTILCAGRLDAWSVKGFDRIINVWGKIHTHYPDWTLEIAGYGDSQSEKKLAEMAHEAGITSQFKLLGRISDMKTLYGTSSVFALPSRVEGFPMVLTEAMSQGCPCISFSMGHAVDEIIEDGVDGIIINDGDLADFELELCKLLSNRDLRKSIGDVSIRSVERFSTERYISDWYKILTEITD